MPMIARCCGLSLLAMTAVAAGAPELPPATPVPGARPSPPRASRTAAPPVVDGQLDDSAWAQVPATDHFVQLFPASGRPPTERTEMRVAYDDQAIYVALQMYDSRPDGVVARLTRRDRDIETDWVAVAFDSRRDKRTGFYFALSAAGVQRDGVYSDDSELDTDWDAVWDGAVHRDAGGWSAEFRIPLSVLRFPDAGTQTWGFQAWRHISRNKEDIAWAFRPNDVQGQVSWFGDLEGLVELRPKRAFELRPFATTRLTGTTSRGQSLFGSGGGDVNLGASAGLDARVALTSDLTLDATFNPDFGQVEADQVILNLSRFEVFFPEKRAFFLEGADIFRTPLQLFYSRRIGHSPTGLGQGDSLLGAGETHLTVSETPDPIRIWLATKLVGALSDNVTIGVLGGVTDAERIAAVDDSGARQTVRLAPPQSYGVARARVAVGRGYVGLLATAVNRLGGSIYSAAADHDAYAQAVDGFWTSEGSKYRLTAQAVVSERVGGVASQTDDGRPCQDLATTRCIPITRQDGTRLEPGSVGYGATAQLDIRDGKLALESQYKTLSPRLDINDAGFLPQFNLHSLRVQSGRVDTEPGGVLQSLGTFGYGVGAISFDGVLKDASVGTLVESEFRNFVSGSIDVGALLPGTWDTAETLDGARLERVWGLNPIAAISSDPRRDLVASAYVAAFVRNTNRLASLGGGVTMSLQITPRLQLELLPELSLSYDTLRLQACVDELGATCTVDTRARHYRFAELDSGSLSLTTRGTYTISPHVSLQWYGQLFTAKGEYGRYTEIDTMEVHPSIRRDDLRPSAFSGDSDGDGIKDDDFQETTLNINAVVRWEFRPGSVIYAVYTRAQSADAVLAGERPRFRLGGLSSGRTEDVAMVKLTYLLR